MVLTKYQTRKKDNYSWSCLESVPMVLLLKPAFHRRSVTRSVCTAWWYYVYTMPWRFFHAIFYIALICPGYFLWVWKCYWWNWRTSLIGDNYNIFKLQNFPKNYHLTHRLSSPHNRISCLPSLPKVKILCTPLTPHMMLSLHARIFFFTFIRNSKMHSPRPEDQGVYK